MLELPQRSGVCCRLNTRCSNQELYDQCSLAFDSIPQSKESINLVEEEQHLVGHALWSEVRAEGTFSVSSNDEAVKQGTLGSLNVSCDNYGASDIPLVAFGFELASEQEVRSLRSTLLAGLASSVGQICLNLVCKQVESVDALFASFHKDGASPIVEVRGVSVVSDIGIGKIDI